MHALIAAAGFLFASAGGAAWAQDGSAVVVRSIVISGVASERSYGPLQVALRSPGGSDSTVLTVGQVLAPGTRITTGEGVLVELARERPAVRIVVEPRTRLTVQRSSADAMQTEVGNGSAQFSLVSRLGFYFEVSGFRKVFAIAKGTRFTVAAQPACSSGEGAPSVSLALVEGWLDVESLRPVQLGAFGPSAREDASVSFNDTMQAGQRLTISLDPAQFALRFDTWVQAERFFADALAEAERSGDALALRRALRNQGVILRLGGRHAQAVAVAQRGIELAQSAGDRLWQFRFLSDQAFATWLGQRDRSALPLFERVLALADALQSQVDPADLAALYGRYGATRFEARDRTKPQADLAVAEDYLQRGLHLREALQAERPTLDLSLSHYDLGVLQRVARQDYAAAVQHFEQALAVRRSVLCGRDDVFSAEIEADMAVALALRTDATAPPVDGVRAAYADVAQRFEHSLATLARLFPGGNYRSLGAVARRAADFHSDLGERLTAAGQAAQATDELRTAVRLYEQALTVFSRMVGNSSLERRYALRGLGDAQRLSGEPTAAAASWRGALALAEQERCNNAPEAASDTWVQGLLQRLASAPADAAGAAGAATRRLAQPGLGIVCPARPAASASSAVP